MDTKQWWKSKTLWGVFIAITATALQLFGVVTISEAEQASAVDMLIRIVDLIAQFMGFVMIIYGRIVATKRIGKVNG